MKNHKQIFWLLFTAYTVSIVYQYYRSTINQFPAYDGFGAAEITGYVIFFGWSGLALIQRKWAVRAIVSLCFIQLFVGLFLYTPVIFVKRHDTFWDWAENIVFLSLIALAGYKAWMELKKYKRNNNLQINDNQSTTNAMDLLTIKNQNC